jgi:hypothetical protein
MAKLKPIHPGEILREEFMAPLRLNGRVARPFPFPCHKILSARHSNAIPLHSLRVKVLKLGCPVLDAFSRAGLLLRLAMRKY